MYRHRLPLRLDVDRVEIVRGIRALQAAEHRERKRATITFDGERLTISFGEVAVSARGNGTWDGEVRIKGNNFKTLSISANAEIGSSTVPVRMENGRFFVGPVSTACTWRRP